MPRRLRPPTVTDLHRVAAPRKRAWHFAGSAGLGLLLLAAGCAPSAEELADEALAQTRAQRDRAIERCAMGSVPLNVVDGDMVVLPSCRRAVDDGVQRLGFNGRHVLFANFDGVDVRPGDTSLENEGLRELDTQEPIEVARYAASNEESQRLSNILKIQKLLAGWYADFNIDVVISRPLTGDYQMTVVGDKESIIGEPGGVVGISPVDCKNSNDSNLNYAFSASLGDNPDQTAITIAHENGHAYGLHHTDNNKDIMYPSVTPAEGFRKGKASRGPCGLRAGIDDQDSYQVLVENLGVRPAGVEKPARREPPTVEIMAPKDGESVGHEVTIAVRAASSAAQGIDHITLGVSLEGPKGFRGAHPVAELRPPFSATQIRLSHAGNYQLTATAYDVFGNVAVQRIGFKAATITCSEPNDCSPGQRCESNTCITPPLPSPAPAGMMDEGLRAYGSTCDKTSDCKGGICAVTAVGQICTHYCNSDRLCAGGLECTDGICMPQTFPRSSAKPGQLGGKCNRKEDCFTGECSPFIDVTTPRYCTKVCEPTTAWSCPSTMTCTETDAPGGGGVRKNMCIAKPAGAMAAAGGCSVGGESSRRSQGGQLALSAMILALAGLAVVRRGRRRHGALGA